MRIKFFRVRKNTELRHLLAFVSNRTMLLTHNNLPSPLRCRRVWGPQQVLDIYVTHVTLFTHTFPFTSALQIKTILLRTNTFLVSKTRIGGSWVRSEHGISSRSIFVNLLLKPSDHLFLVLIQHTRRFGPLGLWPIFETFLPCFLGRSSLEKFFRIRPENDFVSNLSFHLVLKSYNLAGIGLKLFVEEDEGF